MIAVSIRPDGTVQRVDIENSLNGLNGQLDGGHIEYVRFVIDHVHAYVDEEGKLKGLPMNDKATRVVRYFGMNRPDEIIVGPMIICGDDGEGDEASLSETVVCMIFEFLDEPYTPPAPSPDYKRFCAACTVDEDTLEPQRNVCNKCHCFLCSEHVHVWSYRQWCTKCLNLERLEVRAHRDPNLPLRIGPIYATIGADALLEEHDMHYLSLIQRHQKGDWGDAGLIDWRSNNQALMYGTRILSVYSVGERKVWVLTEADRSQTTILLPDEY